MQECKFKVGDVVRRVEWIDSYSNKPNNGEPWEISNIQQNSFGRWFLGFVADKDSNGATIWEGSRFALVSRAEEQHTKHKYCIWCETCQGSGEIDETLGGISTSSANVPYPDCKGKGYYIKYTTSPFGVDGCAVSSEQSVKRNKYSREIRPNVFIDVYDVLRAFEVNDPCLSHLAKKALCAGLRGHKNRLQDLEDIKVSIERAIEMHKEWEL